MRPNPIFVTMFLAVLTALFFVTMVVIIVSSGERLVLAYGITPKPYHMENNPNETEVIKSQTETVRRELQTPERLNDRIPQSVQPYKQPQG